MIKSISIVFFFTVSIINAIDLPPTSPATPPTTIAPILPPVATDDKQEHLRKLLADPQLSASQKEALRYALQALQQQNTEKNLSGENRQLVEQIRDNLQKQFEAQPRNRALALLFIRYLLFLDDAPSALQLLEKIRPASAEDATWNLLMATVHLQLGDQERAGLHLENANNLLQRKRTFSLSTPIAVTAVEAYRIYTTERRDIFTPSQSLLLYVEIANAQFKIRGSEWACQLDFALELVGEDKTVYDRNPDYGRYELTYNGKVQEIHATLNYQLPADLPKGKYVLRVLGYDVVAENRGQTEFVFKVSGAEKEKITERKVDAEMYLNKDLGKQFKDLNNNLPPDEWGIIDDLIPPEKSDEEKNTQKQGADLSRERSKRHGDLLQR